MKITRSLVVIASIALAGVALVGCSEESTTATTNADSAEPIVSPSASPTPDSGSDNVEPTPEANDPSVSSGEIDENGFSNIQTDNSLILVESYRYDNYDNEEDPFYVYGVEITGLDELEAETCQLSLNGDVLKEEECVWLLEVRRELEMAESGDYELSSGGKTYVSWTFTRPNDTPPLKGPAECVIEDAKVTEITPEDVTLKLTTDDKCEEGSWGHISVSDSGQIVASLGGVVGKKLTPTGLLTIGPLGEDDRPADVTVIFTPDEFLVSTEFEIRVP